MRIWLAALKEDLERDAEYERKDNERRRETEFPYAGDDIHSAASLDAFNRLVGLKECEVVWRALERRADSAARSDAEVAFEQGRYAAEMAALEDADTFAPVHKSLSSYCLWREGVHEATGTGGIDPPSRHIADMGRSLIWTIAEIRTTPIPQETSAKRKAKLREVEQAVERLREAIAPLWGEGPYFGRHFYQGSPLDQFAIKMVDRWVMDLAIGRLVAPDAESVAVAYQAVKQSARRPFDYLGALVADVAEWADEPPELAKPNDPNAARLLFIRKLTAHFRSELGEPLRACVLAIASAFFDCSTLDEAAITKLAP